MTLYCLSKFTTLDFMFLHIENKLASDENGTIKLFSVHMGYLAVPLRREGQLYRWPRHSLTDYYTLLKNTAIEHSERLVTLETCDQSDEET